MNVVIFWDIWTTQRYTPEDGSTKNKYTFAQHLSWFMAMTMNAYNTG
jgi:hypothetical protein